MARHYRGFCLSTQVAIFPLSRAPQRSNNGASFNLTGNASVEFWRCDQLIREHTQDYIRYLSRSIVYQLRVRLRLKLQHAFGEHIAGSRRHDEANLASRIARARARFTGVRGDYATSFDTECFRSPPRGGVHRYEYSHPLLDRHWGSLRYSLTPTTSTIRSKCPVASAKRHRVTNNALNIRTNL